MSHPICIWSKAYAPAPDTDTFSIQVDKSLWEEVMRQEGSRRKFLSIEHPDGFDSWIAPIGQPVQVDHDEENPSTRNLYLPLWMIDAGHFGGEGEAAVVNIMDEEFFPEATKIVLRVIDSAFYNADIKQELERALSAMGVIREHTTLQIPVEALGGYAVEVFIAQTEPANVVLCDGEEVAVEFQEPVDQIAPPRPPTPVPRPPTPVPRPPTPIPEAPRVVITDTMVPAEFPSATGFQAFQGQGRLLGGSNASIPEWRRELGLPRRPQAKP